MDVAFIATFLLSLPAALLADLSHIDSRTAIDVAGILARQPDGSIDAWVMQGQISSRSSAGAAGPGTTARGTNRLDETILGNFRVTVQDDLRGWPLVTTIERRPARLDLDILSEVTRRTGVPRDHADVFQRAVERALQEDEQADALAAWNLSQPDTQRQWWAWIVAAGAWWIIMFFTAAFAIQLLRFGWLLATGRRLRREAARRLAGKCPECGYDLTGLDFNLYCPECGAEVW